MRLEEKDKDLLEPLVKLSAQIGSDPMLIQASGGNTSEKIDSTLWVKASGLKLMDAQKKWMFVPVRLPETQEAIASGDGDDISRYVQGETGLRPSIETTLHALLPHRVVLHVHSVHTICHVVQTDGKSKVSKCLEGLRWTWITYHRPGLPLTQAVFDAIPEEPDILILQNHGLVVGGKDVHAAQRLLETVEKRLFIAPRSVPEVKMNELSPFLEAGFRLPKDPVIHGLATDAACHTAIKGGVPYPDHVIFLPPIPLIVASYQEYKNARENFKNRFDMEAPAILVPGVGVVVRDDITFSAEEMLRAQANVFLRVPPESRIRYLSDSDVASLLNWEAEKFRRSLNN
jgi:rhamnose utilization protein RhaD (predicted bifunctional aldolase and dehydrogenase)